MRDLSAVMGFGLLAVFCVLLAQFRRARLAFVVIISVPLAVVGALLTLWLTQIPLNASSLMGCVLLGDPAAFGRGSDRWPRRLDVRKPHRSAVPRAPGPAPCHASRPRKSVTLLHVERACILSHLVCRRVVEAGQA